MKKKIAFIVKYFPTVSETFIVNQINALIDNGHAVTVYSYNHVHDSLIHNSLLKYELLNNTIYFNKPSTSKIQRVLFAFKWILKHRNQIAWSSLMSCFNIFKYGKESLSLKLFYEMQWFLLDCDYHIIHAHFGGNAKRIAYLKQLKLLPKNTELVSTFHGYDLLPEKEQYYNESYKYVFEHSSTITVNTPYMYSLLKNMHVDLQKVEILPVGLDTSYFKPFNYKATSKVFQIVFCGKLIPLKAADLAVEIVRKILELGYNNVCLHIIGNGSMYNDIKTTISKYRLDKHVVMYGALSQDKVKHFFNQSDVFLFPGKQDLITKRAETQGLVVQEAQAMELPVVVSDVGGIKYGMLDGETGFVIKENDIDGFARCIEKLILDEQLKSDMGKSGRRFVEENYDNKILVKKLERIYESII